MSSTYVAVPVMSRGSSRRRMRLPTNVSVLVVVVAIPGLLLSGAGCGGFHCVDDVLVSGAAADVAFEPVANLLFAGSGVTVDNLLGGRARSRRLLVQDRACRRLPALPRLRSPRRWLARQTSCNF